MAPSDPWHSQRNTGVDDRELDAKLEVPVQIRKIWQVGHGKRL